MRTRPVLLVDVDGVISLFGFPLGRRPAGRFEMVDGIAHLLSATAGDHLRTLATAFDPVWCTGWEEKANEYLPRALGLPAPYPYLRFDQRDGDGRPRTSTRAHWKLDAIDAHAGASPLAWIDDAHDEACASWAAARRAPTLLVTTEPAIGLTADDVERLLAWAAALGGGPAAGAS